MRCRRLLQAQQKLPPMNSSRASPQEWHALTLHVLRLAPIAAQN
jgi:RNA polymerase subunit RPABC4/transcription elongation factor Spt4